MAKDINQSEIAQHADFSSIRYAQVWEDADVLLQGLNLQPGDSCLSIASAGDNCLALLSQQPKRVVALDLNPAQLACLELRVAAFRELNHDQLLCLIGSRQSYERAALYKRCRGLLSEDSRRFWDANPAAVEQGIGTAGKFEHYFKFFRQKILPWIHRRRRIEQLLQGGDPEQRRRFYQNQWNTRAWRALFKVFFSRFVMGRMGRDPAFFRYAEGDVASVVLKHTEYALTELNPLHNPYLQWILTGRHTTALPFALREENFDIIRDNLDCLEWHLDSVEDYLGKHPGVIFNGFNLSDIFEYMSEDHYHRLLQQITAAAAPGARLVYWNMMVPRRRPDTMAAYLQPLTDLSKQLYAQDKAFFYRDMIVEEVV